MRTIMTSLKKIKFKYIGCWLKDQLSRPDRFRNLFVNRSAWGAFSIYAHTRRSDGKSKVAYSNKAKAEKAAFDMSKRYRKDRGLTTNKIMRMLNVVYKKMTEVNGKEPIPVEAY